MFYSESVYASCFSAHLSCAVPVRRVFALVDSPGKHYAAFSVINCYLGPFDKVPFNIGQGLVVLAYGNSSCKDYFRELAVFNPSLNDKLGGIACNLIISRAGKQA